MKQSAVEFLVEQIKKDSNLRLRGFDIDGIGNKAKEMEKQQQGYSEEEFLEFSEWVSHNDWVYLPSKGYWVNEEQEELEEKFTTKQLFEQFKNKEEPIQEILENLENQLKKVIKEHPIDVNEDTYWRGIKNGLKVAIEVIKFKVW